MTKQSRVLVIIPAYNESEAILDTVNDVIATGFDYVVVNDGSTDATLDICRSNHVNALNLPQNLGIGGAVQAGHKYAKKFGYEIDIQVDGDGQHDPSYIAALVEQVDAGSDLVVGSRFLEKTEGFQSTAMRRLGIAWLSGVIRALTHRTVTDPTSGFRACGPRAINLFCEDYPTDYPEPDSIVTALSRGLVVSEVPVCMRERQGGMSSISGFSNIYYMIKVTLAILISAFSKSRY